MGDMDILFPAPTGRRNADDMGMPAPIKEEKRCIWCEALEGDHNSALWPLADEEERNNGWTLSCRFLRAVKLAAQAHNADISMEATEAVLLAAQAHALLSSNVK